MRLANGIARTRRAGRRLCVARGYAKMLVMARLVWPRITVGTSDIVKKYVDGGKNRVFCGDAGRRDLRERMHGRARDRVRSAGSDVSVARGERLMRRRRRINNAACDARNVTRKK